MKQQIRELVQAAVAEAFPEFSGVAFEVSVPKLEHGDYSTNAALVLAKQMGKNPNELAIELASKISNFEFRISKIQAIGGFINFTLSEEALLGNLEKVLQSGDKYGSSSMGKNEKVLVEYFQPNMAKPLHLGHLRTAVIGDALFRLLEFTGYSPESDTHLGDWGTQFGLLILAYKKYGSEEVVAKDPIAELNKLYVQINAEAEADKTVQETGKQEFVKLEQGDEENLKLWQKFRSWSWSEYDVVYNELGVRRADHDWPESFYQDKMPQVIQQLKARGLLVESQGAQIVNLEDHGLGVAVVVKSDGGTTYLLRDLATYIYRKSQGFARQLYVVDVRQSQTLAQTFKILELLGVIAGPEEAVHVAYGFLTLPEGAMSTRKGNVVGLAELVQKAQELALEIIEQKNPKLPDKEQTAKLVAMAAIKYFDLSRNPKGDVVFTWDKALAFEGNTGPYMQYAFARIQSILRKANIKNEISSREAGPRSAWNLKSQIPNLKIQERVVLRKLLHFPEAVEQATASLLPNVICSYVFELAQAFNSFYETSPVLKEENQELHQFRLALCEAVAQVIKNSLGLLGVQAPEEM